MLQLGAVVHIVIVLENIVEKKNALCINEKKMNRKHR
jgi:hypothetical protein